MGSDFSVIAIISAYNEADIIGQVVSDLIHHGIQVYVLDDGSTDGTIAAVEPFLNRGVVGIERLTDTKSDAAAGSFDWERILRRKSALAATLDASWFIHHDADEFRESPWAHLSLSEAIRRVDALGFNAIDFAGIDFWPIDDGFRPGDDVRKAFTFCSEQPAYDRVQIRCWKKTGNPVDLVSSGGHDASFPGRTVFPVRFILRHYPIRGQAHGERKVFRERRSRFREEERARGWHVQYDGVDEGASFLRDPSTLATYDADAMRIELTLRHRDVEALEKSIEASHQELARIRADRDAVAAEAARLRSDLERHAAELTARRAELDGLRHALAEFQRSLSWRWTAPARTAYRVLKGR